MSLATGDPMNKELSDQELVEILQERLDSNRKSLFDLREITTVLEKTNARLQESEALKGHFLSNIRNEINNPLSSIMGLAREILDNSAANSKAAVCAPLIYDEAFNLDFQLQNIFIAAELEAGEAVPSFAKVDINNVIESVCETLIHQGNKKQITVRNDTAPELFLTTDAQKLHLILTNLLTNAMEFGEIESEVLITAAIDDAKLQLSVTNSGVGIAPEAQERIFDRFRQLDEGTTKCHRGHGLGLSIVKALVELLGGTISLSSTAGEGCVVNLILPEQSSEIDVVAQDSNLFLFENTEQF
jgi:signal transduction histidine kinase